MICEMENADGAPSPVSTFLVYRLLCGVRSSKVVIHTPIDVNAKATGCTGHDAALCREDKDVMPMPSRQVVVVDRAVGTRRCLA